MTEFALRRWPLSIEACALTGRNDDGSGYVIVEYRELLSQTVTREDYGAGPEVIVRPEYGRVVASSQRLPRSRWSSGVRLDDLALEVLGPKPACPPVLCAATSMRVLMWSHSKRDYVVENRVNAPPFVCAKTAGHRDEHGVGGAHWENMSP